MWTEIITSTVIPQSVAGKYSFYFHKEQNHVLKPVWKGKNKGSGILCDLLIPTLEFSSISLPVAAIVSTNSDTSRSSVTMPM